MKLAKGKVIKMYITDVTGKKHFTVPKLFKANFLVMLHVQYVHELSVWDKIQ